MHSAPHRYEEAAWLGKAGVFADVGYFNVALGAAKYSSTL
jgi:hypothetical protein